jgi:hypothetical protein
MIEEINTFLNSLIVRYGTSGFVTEVTITNQASQFISTHAPSPGNHITLYCAMGKVRIKNGGDEKEEFF